MTNICKTNIPPSTKDIQRTITHLKSVGDLPETDNGHDLYGQQVISLNFLKHRRDVVDYALNQLLECKETKVSEEWMPISSAPKDTTVIAWNGKKHGYSQQSKNLTGDYVWSGAMAYTQPTHWKPLPQPPKTEQKENT